jgi:hypothetical protein
MAGTVAEQYTLVIAAQCMLVVEVGAQVNLATTVKVQISTPQELVDFQITMALHNAGM